MINPFFANAVAQHMAAWHTCMRLLQSHPELGMWMAHAAPSLRVTQPLCSADENCLHMLGCHFMPVQCSAAMLLSVHDMLTSFAPAGERMCGA